MITHTDNVKLIRLLLVEKFAILDEKNSDMMNYSLVNFLAFYQESVLMDFFIKFKFVIIPWLVD